MLKEREKVLIKNFTVNTPIQPLKDIFLEFKMSDRLTTQNLKKLVIKVAKMALIRGPTFG